MSAADSVRCGQPDLPRSACCHADQRTLRASAPRLTQVFEIAIQTPLRVRLRIGRWHFRTWRSWVTKLPRGYREPEMVYTVEWHDEEGRSLGQAGAFFSLQAAERCLAELRTGVGDGELVVNMIAVHSRLADWRYDR